MLIKFDYLKEKYNISAKGVLHIGGSTGQEAQIYAMNGMQNQLWIEAIPSVYEELKTNLLSYSQAMAICACIGDVDGKKVEFNISSNSGESSSYLEFGTHAQLHKDVTFVDKISMNTIRIDTLLAKQGIDISGYDFLNIDIQGAEIFALRGMGDLLKNFRYAYLEVNWREVYKGCSLVSEVDDYLAKYGFVGVEEKAVTNANGEKEWGDKFYIKQL